MNECVPLIANPFHTKNDFSSNHHDGTTHNDNEEDPSIGHSLYWTDELRAYVDQNEEIVSAAYHLRDAILLTMSSFLFSETYHPELLYSNSSSDSKSLKLTCHRILAQPLVQSLVTFASSGLILLSFVEFPYWCQNYEDGDNDPLNGCWVAFRSRGIPAFYVDDTEDRMQEYYPNSGVSFLHPYYSHLLEWFFVCIILMHIFLGFGRDGIFPFKYTFFHSSLSPTSSLPDINHTTAKSLKITAIVRSIRIVSIILLIIGLLSFPHLDIWRSMSLFLRMSIFLTYAKGVQREIVNVVNLLSSLISVFFVLFLVILFYGMFGVVVFYETEEGQLWFPNLIDAMWTLWTSMTTVIYPDVMMPAYNENRLVALYFISFMAITYFFLANVILAAVVSTYQENHTNIQNDLISTRRQFIEDAFQLVDKNNQGYVTKPQIMAIFLILNEDCYQIRTIPSNEADILFSLLDRDNSEQVTKDDFLNFGTLMLIEFEDFSKYTNTWFKNEFPQIVDHPGYKKIEKLVLSDVFDNFMDVVVLINAILVIIQSYPLLSGTSKTTKEAENVTTPWAMVETVFTITYCIEMAVKLSILGMRRYTSSGRNMFDGFITILSLMASIYVWLPNGFDDTRVIKFVLMARVCRTLRLFMSIEPLEIIGRTFLAIIPKAGYVLSLLCCMMYVFASIGMIWFGGKISRNPTDDHSLLLNGTSFADNYYWSNNFNDLTSGMNVVFNLLVINNWNEMESGIVAVSQTKYCRYFFFSFYVSAVIIVNNLVIALILDEFFHELKETKKLYKEYNYKKHHHGDYKTIQNDNGYRGDDDKDVEVHDDRRDNRNQEFSGRSIIFDAKSNKSKYVASLKLNDQSDHERMRILHSLFSKK